MNDRLKQTCMKCEFPPARQDSLQCYLVLQTVVDIHGVDKQAVCCLACRAHFVEDTVQSSEKVKQ